MLWPLLETVIARSSVPNLQFPSTFMIELRLASYPFREAIRRCSREVWQRQQFRQDGFERISAVFVKSRFNINKIEPWSEHFHSLDAKYLDELRSIVEKSGGAIVNIAVDGEHSPYAVDKAEREKAISFSRQWIDVAVSVGSPSVRTSMPQAKDSKPDLDRAAGSLVAAWPSMAQRKMSS